MSRIFVLVWALTSSLCCVILILWVAREKVTPKEELLCGKERGLLWYRGLARNPDCAKVERMLKVIGARRIVVGHTRNEKMCPGAYPDAYRLRQYHRESLRTATERSLSSTLVRSVSIV